MTGAGKVIYSLLNVPAINALIGDRIYPVVAPNDASTFPCCVYEIDSTDQVNHKDRLNVQADGSRGRRLDIVTVTIYSSAFEYAQAEALENEVRKAFDGFRGEIEGVCVDGVMLQNSSDTYNYELEIFEKETIYTIRINY